MRDKTLNTNLEKINSVIKDFATENGFETIDSSNVLSPSKIFTLTIDNSVVRADDGVHITNEGGKMLSEYIFKQIGKFIDLTNVNNDPPIPVIKATGCCVTPRTTTTYSNSGTSTGKTTSSTSATSTAPTTNPSQPSSSSTPSNPTSTAQSS